MSAVREKKWSLSSDTIAMSQLGSFARIARAASIPATPFPTIATRIPLLDCSGCHPSTGVSHS
jgi:hypothetical protein